MYINDNLHNGDMEGANYNWGITLLVQKSAGHSSIIDLTNKSRECLGYNTAVLFTVMNNIHLFEES